MQLKYWRMAACALALAGAAGLSDHAAAKEFENVVLSTTEDGAEPTDSFATDTPMIHLNMDIDDVDSGSKVSAIWISIDSGGVAPPNYKIDEVTLDVGVIDNHFHATLSRPNNGWPVGTYQVQLAVDGKVVEAVPFSVK